MYKDQQIIEPLTGRESGYLDMELLRFTTAGSVDDGKSTLIGRLLYDSKSIFEDQLQAVKEVSAKSGFEEEINLALLTDGLRAEREQGITIDVAYRYFATPRRKFIIADTPGHTEYTRNMVTGASTADVAIILVDARKGILEQTKRHSYIAALLNISTVILAVNKMDLVDYSAEVFEKIRHEFESIRQLLSLSSVHYLPISAKDGDNVVVSSPKMPWYGGKSLLGLLETIPVHLHEKDLPARFPVQYVISSDQNQTDFPGYAGRIASGNFHEGETILVMPGNRMAKIKSIFEGEKQLKHAVTSQSVTIYLSHYLPVKRGDMLVKLYHDEFPKFSSKITLMICWLNPKPLKEGIRYIVRHTTDETIATVTEVRYKVNINSLENNWVDKNVVMNDIAHITLKADKPFKYDDYSLNRITGSLVLIDPETHETVGAGMIVSDPEVNNYNI